MATFRRATKTKSRLRAAFDGTAGSGKTFTALRGAAFIASTIPGGRIAVINSESGAVEKYLGLAPDGIPFDFDVCELTDYAPTSYTAAILEAGRAGYAVLIIDSLSHAWEGSGGALELVDRKKGSSANSFTAWKEITPMHRRMIDAILRSPCHVMATMRTKTEYVLEEQVNQQGRKVMVPRKVGMAPIQRQGMEYEFDVVGDLDVNHTLTVSKTRCPAIDGVQIVKPGAEFFKPLLDWLNGGVEPPDGYYTASEADLKALEDRQVKAERAAAAAAKEAQPKKSVEELMAEAAARNGSNGNGESSDGGVAGVPGSTGASESSGIARASQSQDSIAAASPSPTEKKSIGEPPRNTTLEEWAAYIAATTPANRSDPGSITDAQQERIKGYAACLAPEVSKDAIKRAIEARGANKLAELSFDNANGLLDNLVRKGLELGRCPPAPRGNGHANETHLPGKEAAPAGDENPTQ